MSAPAMYKQAFFVILSLSGDVGPEMRARVARAALTAQLEDHTILFATSAGGYDDKEKPEISLVLPSNADATSYLKLVRRALLNEGVEDVAELEEQAWFYELTEEKLAHVRKTTRIHNVEQARQSIDQLVNLPKAPALPHASTFAVDLSRLLLGEQGHSPVLAANAGSIPPENRLDGFSVDADTYRRLKDARGSAIAEEVERLEQSLKELVNATKTNVAVADMVINGIMTVGEEMYAKYVAAGTAGSVTALISGLISAVGGIGAFVTIVAAVAAVCSILLIAVKDAFNELLMVNALTTEITMANPEDFILHGERYGVTLNIPAALDPSKIDKPMAYPAGFYIYRKARIGDQLPIGFRGSTLGMAFNITGTNKSYSIGLDCPQTIFGGTNCIYVREGADAKTAAERADETGNSTMTVTMGDVICTGSRAAALGSVNRAVCCVSGSIN